MGATHICVRGHMRHQVTPMSSTDASAAETTQDDGACPVADALEQIGSRWRLAVLYELRDGERRFNDLKRGTGANSRTLSRVLDDL